MWKFPHITPITHITHIPHITHITSKWKLKAKIARNAFEENWD